MSSRQRHAHGQADAQPFISMQDVSLRLYGRVLFEHTCWEILNHQHWAVTGPNGSGKSVLMKAICGQVPVIKGKITYHFSANGALAHKHVALVSFDTRTQPVSRESLFYQARWNVGAHERVLSVSDYLSEGHVLRINPFQVLQEPVGQAGFAAHRKQVIDLLDIRPLLSRELIQLSNGERRKVTIARALLKKPRLLILDNPFAGLDSHFRAKFQDIVRRLTREQLRIVVVTARPDEIPPDITHVLSVRDCRVVAQGPREAILEQPSLPPRDLALDLERGPIAGEGSDDAVLVRMRDVDVSYGDKPILSDINWTVRRGDHWALLGPNGSGKTTLLSLIMGDHPQAYANDIALFGKRRGSGESIWQIKKRIGWVSPELHMYYPKQISCLRVSCSGFFDSVGLFSKCSAQQRQAALSWMRRLGIEHRADQLFSKISEGEQRLVLLARALVKQPLLLVLDEPCQGLDAPNRQQICRVVDAIGGQMDTTVIYVTHDTDELPQIITHAMHLDGGKTAFAGRIQDRTGAQPS
jgi:molybdate transport system ATP-binding protein